MYFSTRVFDENNCNITLFYINFLFPFFYLSCYLSIFLPMRFNRDASCSSCSSPCDIYQSSPPDAFGSGGIEPLHVHYGRHQTICKQDSPVTHVIYLLQGSAKLYIEGINQRHILLYILTPERYIGLLSFFETPRYAYSVTSLEDSTVCMVELDYVKRLYLRNHAFLIRLNQAFGHSVASIMRKIITLNQKNIRGRVADSLLYLARLYNSDSYHLLLTRKELGELSAISEENCVRILSEFRKEGIIKVCKRQVTILEKDLLRKISEFG